MQRLQEQVFTVRSPPSAPAHLQAVVSVTGEWLLLHTFPVDNQHKDGVYRSGCPCGTFGPAVKKRRDTRPAILEINGWKSF
jgi:hypothetical protein